MDEVQNSMEYADTAFDSRKHQFSSYEKTDFKPSLLGLPRKNRIDKQFLKEQLSDYEFTGFHNDINCLKKYKQYSKSLNFHRYHYRLYECGYDGGKDYFVYLIAIILLLIGITLFFVSTGTQSKPSLGVTIFTVCSILIFKLNLYYQSSFDPSNYKIYDLSDNTRFDRFTGMLLLKKEDETIEIPFKELDVYYYTTSSGNLGLSTYIVTLAHRYSDNGYNFTSGSHFYAVMGKLSYLIRFMDISKPLPNLPMLVLDRDNDPISHESKDSSILELSDWEKIDNDNWLQQVIDSGDKLKEIYGSR